MKADDTASRPSQRTMSRAAIGARQVEILDAPGEPTQEAVDELDQLQDALDAKILRQRRYAADHRRRVAEANRPWGKAW